MGNDSSQNPMAITSIVEPANNDVVDSPVKFFAMIDGVVIGAWPYELEDITNKKLYTGETQALVGVRRTLELSSGGYDFRCRIKPPVGWTDWGYVRVVVRGKSPLIYLPREYEYTVRRPWFSGTGQSNASIKLVGAGNPIIVWSETVLVSSEGEWKVDVNRDLPLGSNSLWAIQEYVGETLPSETRTINVSVPLTISVPGSGAVVSNPFTFKGTGTDGATIVVVSSSNHKTEYSDPIKVTSSGVWEVSAKNSLSGPHSVQAQQTLPGGKIEHSTPPVSFSVLIRKPVITSPDAHSLQNMAFRIGGTGGVAGALIEILLDVNHSVKFGETQVTGANWNVDVNVDPGRRSLVARQTEPGVTPSEVSDPRVFDIRPPALTKVDVTYPSATSIKFAGAGLNGAWVEIRKVSGPDATMPAAVRVGNGQWEAIANGLPFGTYQLVAIHMVDDGADGWIEALPFSFSVTYGVPVPYNVSSNTDYQPTLTGKGVLNGVVSFFDPDQSTKVAPDAPVNALDIWSSTVSSLWGPTWQRKVYIRQTVKGEHSVFIVHNVDIPPLAPVIETVEKESLTPLISGKCCNSARVQLKFDNNGIKLDATVNGVNWTYRSPDPFESGTTHTVKVTQIAAQQPSPPATETFKVEGPMIVPQQIFPAKAENVERNLRVRGSDGMKGATVILRDAQFGKELGRTSAPLQQDGEWVIELKTLSFRLYTVEVMQKIAERESAWSEWSTFTVVLMTHITDPLPGRTRTRDAEFQGMGLEGGLVDLYLGNASEPFARSVLVGPDGYWRTTARLDVGLATVRVEQSFETQLSDAMVTFRVVPKSAFIETPAAGEHIAGRTVLSGFGVEGDTVTVMLGDAANTVLGTTKVEGDGTWSVEVDIPHTGGNVDLVVVSSLGDFASDASPARPVILGTYKPGFSLPSEGDSVHNPVHFAGGGQQGLGTLWKWFNPEETLASNVLVSDAGWAANANDELPVGGCWAGFSQTLSNDPDGATLSDRVHSVRFEVEPAIKTDKR